MDNKGFTLIELFITILIITTVSVIAIPTYRDWVKKAGIENDIKNIFALLNQAKTKAFVEKVTCGIVFNGNDVELKCDTDADDAITDESTVISKVVIKNNFTESLSGGVSYVSFSKNGTASIMGNIHASDISTNPAYSCINISMTRIEMGKWDGTGCNVK